MAKKKAKKDEAQGEIYEPDTYRVMSEPFTAADDLSEALTGFFKEVREIRAKYRIADVLFVVKDAYLDHDGEEVPMMARGNNGNVMNCLPMAAWLYAKENADHRQTMKDMLKQGGAAGFAD